MLYLSTVLYESSLLINTMWMYLTKDICHNYVLICQFVSPCMRLIWRPPPKHKEWHMRFAAIKLIQFLLTRFGLVYNDQTDICCFWVSEHSSADKSDFLKERYTQCVSSRQKASRQNPDSFKSFQFTSTLSPIANWTLRFPKKCPGYLPRA